MNIIRSGYIYISAFSDHFYGSLTSCKEADREYSGEYVTGDFHQHTTYSGGDYSIGYVMEAFNKCGLDWWSNSDHGGTREFWGKAFGDDLGTRVTWTCAGIKPLGDPQALIDGLRSGNRFIITGDLITNLNFTVDDAMMGQTLSTDKKQVTIRIEVFDPDTPNFNTCSDYTNPKLDHIDLIAGQVSGLISPDDPDYNKDNVSTTLIIARFDASGSVKDINGLESQKWEDMGNGWKKITYKVEVKGNMYLRLRGTNHPLNTPEELDGAGNPLPDIAEENSPAKAFSDLWFYSNPIFIQTVSASDSQ